MGSEIGYLIILQYKLKHNHYNIVKEMLLIYPNPTDIITEAFDFLDYYLS